MSSILTLAVLETVQTKKLGKILDSESNCQLLSCKKSSCKYGCCCIMCGICCIVYRKSDEEYALTLVTKASKQLKFRGPDHIQTLTVQS